MIQFYFFLQLKALVILDKFINLLDLFASIFFNTILNTLLNTNVIVIFIIIITFFFIIFTFKIIKFNYKDSAENTGITIYPAPTPPNSPTKPRPSYPTPPASPKPIPKLK